MNLKHMEQAIAIMKRAGKFNIEKWQARPEGNFKTQISNTEKELHTCGHTACFGGWVAVSPEWKEFGGILTNFSGAPACYSKKILGQIGPSDTVTGADALSVWLDLDIRLVNCIVYSEIGVNTLLWNKESGGVFSIFYNKANEEVTPEDVIEKLEAYKTNEGVVKVFSDYLNRYKEYYNEYVEHPDKLKERFGLYEIVNKDDAAHDFDLIQYIIDDFSAKKEEV